jgi:hypothetical protein
MPYALLNGAVIIILLAGCAHTKPKPQVCPPALVPSGYELTCPETLPGWKCTVIL